MLTCTNGVTNIWLTNIRYDISHLMLLEWPGECINMGRLQKHFPQLRSLDISNSTSLKYFKGHFDAQSKIEKISIHNSTSLWEVPATVVGNMTQLRELDLRNNTLRHMKANLLRGPPQLQTVYLGDNKWDCSDGGLDWLAMEDKNGTVRRRLLDYYELVCHQQLYRGKPLHKVMDIIRLSSIRQLVQNPQYQKLVDLYLDNNSIQTVKELEGSEWFTTFRVLSLRGNMLKQIPVYAFDKAFQGNNNIMHVFLGQNPWRCDCHFIPRFQGLLLKYKRVIRDLTDIRCAKSDDKSISFVQISTISLGNVCRNNDMKMPISTINIVNLILLALITSVIGKFLYDWHRFRTTGELPWISAVMP
ncbi:protein singed wings 2 isoform X2 [Vanessa tameamea]|uniref:Protein singed wings 2 isoform X2 n=1 Tax=Vanessa tameamea TaxID=334116 RepID=A0A8B8I5C4_VANTA